MAERRFVGYRCKRCGAVAYQRRLLCSSCRGKDFEEYPLGEEGKVMTFTKLWAVPEGIEQIPLILAIAEFEGKVRATGQVLSEELKTGDRVRPVWGHVRKIRGKEVHGFRFERLV